MARVAGLWLLSVTLLAADGEIDFRRQIRPILERCVVCHGHQSPMGSLDLTSREAAIRGGRSGTALRPGDAEGSPLYTFVESREMPQGDPLSEEEIELIRKWIGLGAEWEEEIR